MIPDDVRSTMLKYLDDARQSKEVIARHPATAEHKARAESEIARLTTAIEWTLHQSSQRALVPATELDAAQQRIAELEAEVARLRAEQWTPVAQGTIIDTSGDGPSGFADLVVTGTGFELYEYLNDECDTAPVPLYLPDEYAICKRGDA